MMNVNEKNPAEEEAEPANSAVQTHIQAVTHWDVCSLKFGLNLVEMCSDQRQIGLISRGEAKQEDKQRHHCGTLEQLPAALETHWCPATDLKNYLLNMEIFIHTHLKLALMVANDDADSGGFSSQSVWKPAAGNMKEAPGENVARPSTAGSFLC